MWCIPYVQVSQECRKLSKKASQYNMDDSQVVWIIKTLDGSSFRSFAARTEKEESKRVVANCPIMGQLYSRETLFSCYKVFCSHKTPSCYHISLSFKSLPVVESGGHYTPWHLSLGQLTLNPTTLYPRVKCPTTVVEAFEAGE